MNNAEEQNAAFARYLRGRGGEGSGLEKAPQGGYFAGEAFDAKVDSIVSGMSTIEAVSSITGIASGALQIESTPNGWSGGYDASAIHAYQHYAVPKTTQLQIDSGAMANISEWLAKRVAPIFFKSEDEAFFHGNGINQPRGIVSAELETGVAKNLDCEAIKETFYSLKEEYTKSAVVLMNRKTLEKSRSIVDPATNCYIWQSSLAVGAPETILGLPVYEWEQMGDIGSDSPCVAIGDFRAGYHVVKNIKTAVLRDPFTDKPYVKFFCARRAGGEVMNVDAIKLLKVTGAP